MQHHINDPMKNHLVDYSVEPNSRPCRVYELSLKEKDVVQTLLRGQVKLAYDEREESYMCLLIDLHQNIEYISYSFRIDSNLFWAQLKSKPALFTFRNKAYVSEKTPKEVIYAIRFEGGDEAANEFHGKLNEVLGEIGVVRPNNTGEAAGQKKTGEAAGQKKKTGEAAGQKKTGEAAGQKKTGEAAGQKKTGEAEKKKKKRTARKRDDSTRLDQ